MKFNEALKLENFSEHYSIILGNIDIATKQLEEILRNKESEQENISRLEESRDTLVSKIETLGARLTESLLAIEEAAKVKESSRQTIYETDEYVRSKMKDLKSRIMEEEFLIAELKRENASMIENRSTIEDSVAVLLLQSNDLSKTIVERSKELSSLSATKDKIIKDIEVARQMNDKLIAKHTIELEKIQTKVANEKKKVLDFDAYTEKREKDITRRENDVLVVTNRLRKLFQEVKPGIALKI